MYAHAAQEDWPAVQENLCSPGFNAAKANLIRDPIGLCFHCDIVEFRIVWRPQCQVGAETNLRISVGVGGEGFADPRFGNSHCHFLTELAAVKSDPAADQFARAFLKLDEVILHKCGGCLYQLHLTSESAIVPPICD